MSSEQTGPQTHTAPDPKPRYHSNATKPCAE
nr:MAG TPA: hypothetical protein [Caudoviricetes sp.]